MGRIRFLHLFNSEVLNLSILQFLSLILQSLPLSPLPVLLSYGDPGQAVVQVLGLAVE